MDDVTAPDHDAPRRQHWIARLFDEALLDSRELWEGANRTRALVILAAALAFLVVAVPVLITLVREHDLRIAAGVVFVVLLGAGGLVCRGVGEHRSSSAWKSTGYFLGATAYGASATVALVNGLHTLLSRG